MDLQCCQNKVNNFDKKYAHNVPIRLNMVEIIWAWMRENLSSGFMTKGDYNSVSTATETS